RVVTLHPVVHAGLLADLSVPEHVAELEQLGIEPISLAVVNLYPFSSDPGIELIDVGGPTMVRAAAKNHAHVAVIVDPAQYDDVLTELRTAGELSTATRHRLARDAFAHTAAYDAAIVTWFDSTADRSATAEDAMPRSLHLALDRVQSLRYGENPHQQGARYRTSGARSWWDDAVQHNGKALSYLNLYDTEAAWKLVHRFDEPACVIVKHANPCGVAVADDIASAYRLAHACDPVSAFGGIVACNREVPLELAEALAPVFTEVVVAPSFSDAALAAFAAKANLRVLSAPAPVGGPLDVRSIDGGLLVQQVDTVNLDRSGWLVVTAAQPDDRLWADILVAWQVCAAVSSNAIVLAKDRQAFGIGAGQQNRLDSARIAVERAGGRAVDGVGASDAFFPFRDGLDVVAGAGVRAVVQPGGSVRDDEVIAAADEHGLAMVFTRERHFRH
ncbi:MAG: bifunctional phosphoribosylaminoimidazolecarboxamide formyltransferase/IMP cyclohydrolase, partial [Ilumatobacteraceae bacterium]